MLKDLTAVLDWMLSTHTVPPPHVAEAVNRLKTVHQEVAKEEDKPEEKITA